jgi:hypothetical protein
MGSLITLCMATPLIVAGSAGSGGSVPNGVRGLVLLAATLRSYWVKATALGVFAAVVFSSDPAALMSGPGGVGAVGVVAKGVLLNEGNSDPVYCAAAVVSTGGPVKGSAVPCASIALPCGIEAMRATICPGGGAVSGGKLVGGCVTQIPGSMCRAPQLDRSLIFCK